MVSLSKPTKNITLKRLNSKDEPYEIMSNALS